MRFSAVLILSLLCACRHTGTADTADAMSLDSLYSKVQQYMYEGRISDALSFVEAQGELPDAYILRAYLQLYSLDSTQICALLDSAWNKSLRQGTEITLLYRRMVVSATILASENVGDFDRANSFAKKAIALREEDNTAGSVCETANLLGMIYFHEGNIMESMKAYRTSLEHVAREDDVGAEVQAYLGLAALFHKWSRKKTELEYIRKAMAIISGERHVEVYQSCIAARRAGLAFEVNGEPDSALYYYRQAYHISLTQGMTLYTEKLNEDILRMLKKETEQSVHERQFQTMESNKALRSFIKEQDREMKQLHENLASSLSNEARLNKILVLVCLLLAASIVSIGVYLCQSQRRSRKALQSSESRIKEIEIALSKKEIDISLAEDNAEKFMQQVRAKYPDFIPALTARNPKITGCDLVLCALIALGTGNDSIQELRHISKKSLWAARYRIRTKLHLDHEDALESVLYKILID